MSRHLLYNLGPLVAALLAAGPAAAQAPYPYPPTAYGPRVYNPRGQTLSPYLNLFSGTGSPGVNYYNFVRPNLQMQQQQQIYGGGQLAPIDPYPLATDLTMDPTGPLPRSTGLPVAFMNYGGYFNSMGTMGAPMRGGQPGSGNRTPAPAVSPRR